MRIFAIVDRLNLFRTVSYLFYYEKEKEFHIEIIDDAEPLETPFYLALLLQKGIHSVDAYHSLLWVQQRIVPQDRQNLASILRENGLTEYDEFALLLLSKGRCSQDDYIIREIKERDLPACIQKRLSANIRTVFKLTPDAYVVFFKDGCSRMIDIRNDLRHQETLQAFLKYYKDCCPEVRPEAGGSSLRFAEDVTVSSEALSEAGVPLPFSKDDFYDVLSSQLVNTREACEMLSCSRQNIDDLIRRGKLRPVKESAKDKLFLKSDIEERVK